MRAAWRATALARLADDSFGTADAVALATRLLDADPLDEAALQRCDPDLILSQDLCRVCAVSSGNVDEAVAKLRCRAAVLQIDPSTMGEVIDSVQTISAGDVDGVPGGVTQVKEVAAALKG